jgi:hypothetical protein
MLAMHYKYTVVTVLNEMCPTSDLTPLFSGDSAESIQYANSRGAGVAQSV